MRRVAEVLTELEETRRSLVHQIGSKSNGTDINFLPSVPALPMSQAPSLRQRTEATFRRNAIELQELFDALTPQAKKDASHHLSVLKIAFEALNEEWRQMLAARTLGNPLVPAFRGEGDLHDLPVVSSTQTRAAW